MSYKTAEELIEEARRRIVEVSAKDTIAAVGGADAPMLIDIREQNEWNLGRIQGAIFLPRGQLEQKIEAIAARDARIVLYCASGNRSALGADVLQVMGYTNVSSLAGGWKAWVGAGGPTDG